MAPGRACVHVLTHADCLVGMVRLGATKTNDERNEASSPHRTICLLGMLRPSKALQLLLWRTPCPSLAPPLCSSLLPAGKATCLPVCSPLGAEGNPLAAASSIRRLQAGLGWPGLREDVCVLLLLVRAPLRQGRWRCLTQTTCQFVSRLPPPTPAPHPALPAGQGLGRQLDHPR